MNGFFAIFSGNNRIIEPVSPQWKKPFEFQPSFIQRNSKSQLYLIEQNTSTKFLNEKLWIENDRFLFVSEGIIYNLTDVLTENNVYDIPSLISKFVQEENNTFFSNFKGNFCGILLNKKTNKVIAFNNQTGTKKVYYYKNPEFVIFSTELSVITNYLTQQKIKFSLDIESSYLLLTSGFMHENKTLINEVKQLRAGEFAICENRELQLKNYFHLSDIQERNDSKTDIIHNLNYLFEKAVKSEFDVDKRNKLNHISTLSGGLDSRMTVLIANKSGFKNQQLLNFSEKGYADEVIAKEIADAYSLPLQQIELNSQSMKVIDEVTLVNDGLILYTGCSHVFSTLNKINIHDHGIIHTGMIGDAVMGSFVTKIAKTTPATTDGMYSKSLANKVDSFIKSSFQNYPTEEIYKFYNRAFLGANNGFLFFDLISESGSPFLDVDFLSYAYSIPRQYKINENLYIDWIKTMHPDIANFVWESIGGKPTNNKNLRLYYKYKRAVVKRLPIKTMWKNNMTPEQVWYDKNLSIKSTLDAYFSDNLYRLDSYPELQTDIIYLYNKGKITEKTQAITLLSAIKLLFNEN